MDTTMSQQAAENSVYVNFSSATLLLVLIFAFQLLQFYLQRYEGVGLNHLRLNREPGDPQYHDSNSYDRWPRSDIRGGDSYFDEQVHDITRLISRAIDTIVARLFEQLLSIASGVLISVTVSWLLSILVEPQQPRNERILEAILQQLISIRRLEDRGQEATQVEWKVLHKELAAIQSRLTPSHGDNPSSDPTLGIPIDTEFLDRKINVPGKKKNAPEQASREPLLNEIETKRRRGTVASVSNSPNTSSQ